MNSTRIQNGKTQLKILYKITGTTKLRDFQYRLLLGKTYTNDTLCKWKLTLTDGCERCKSKPQTVRHQFWECPVITARKRSLRRLCFYTCLSVILFTGEGGLHPRGSASREAGQTPPLEGAVRILLECILVEGLLWSELHVAREPSHDPSLEWNDVNVIKILKTTYKARNYFDCVNYKTIYLQ